MSICPKGSDCRCPHICSERELCVLTHPHEAPIKALFRDYVPAVHFIGFSGDEYNSAVRIFGLPDFYHRTWDVRAKLEIAPDDIVVFAKYGPDYKPSKFNYDDSNQPADPAAKERKQLK